MLCREVKRFVYFFLDGSLGEQKRQDFNSHLKLCPDCELRMRIQERLRNFMQSRFARLATTAPDRFNYMACNRERSVSPGVWSRPPIGRSPE